MCNTHSSLVRVQLPTLEWIKRSTRHPHVKSLDFVGVIGSGHSGPRVPPPPDVYSSDAVTLIRSFTGSMNCDRIVINSSIRKYEERQGIPPRNR